MPMVSHVRLVYLLASVAALLSLPDRSLAQFLDINVGPYQFSVSADSFAVANTVGIYIGASTNQLAFRLVGVQSYAGAPNFVIVGAASGTAPTNIAIGLNPNVVAYMAPGTYQVAVNFAPPGQSAPPYAGPVVELFVMPPPPAVTSVVSGASLQPAISPGEVVSIFGANLGTPPVTAQYDDTGRYPSALGNTSVTFNGTSASLLYVSTVQINAVVPFEVAGQKNVDIVVTHDSQASPTFSMAIADTSPAIFTDTQNGKGQGAILNAGPGALSPDAPNGPENPAPKGSAVSIFATGGGLFTVQVGVSSPIVQDGFISLTASAPFAAPVSLAIGGQSAHVLYAGAAPYAVPGMIQVNAVVPNGIGSGPQPVVLTIGNNNNASQQVTVAVK